MDGLPKNKKPWGKAEERKAIALDDYLFERKLQQVYDKTEASDDMPAIVKKMKKLGKAVKQKARNKRTQPKAVKPVKKQNAYIDAPQRTGKRFTKLVKTSQQAAVQPQKNTKKARTYKLRSGALKKYAKTAFVQVKQHKKVTGIVVGVVLLLGIGIGTQTLGSRPSSQPQVAGASTAAKPTFETLVPNQTAKSSIKFDATRQVASYEDKIEEGRIVVSQQKLAEKDLIDANFLSRTATAFNLKTEVTTKKGQAYIGVNIDTNTQFAMFVYKEFLVFLQAEKSYKNQTIVEYIDSLQ